MKCSQYIAKYAERIKLLTFILNTITPKCHLIDTQNRNRNPDNANVRERD